MDVSIISDKITGFSIFIPVNKDSDIKQFTSFSISIPLFFPPILLTTSLSPTPSSFCTSPTHASLSRSVAASCSFYEYSSVARILGLPAPVFLLAHTL